MTQPSHHPARPSGSASAVRQPGVWVRAAVLGAGAAMVWSLGGCQKTLFTQNDERSQFDRHDAARGRLVQPYRFDEFGQQKPNLRGRLLTN